MTMYAVIGTSPALDTSVAVGPYRTVDRALAASNEVEARGYSAEVVPLLSVAELDDSPAWDSVEQEAG